MSFRTLLLKWMAARDDDARVNRSWSGETPDRAALAPVIPLRGGASDRDWALLMRRYGDRWAELPTHLGRMAAHLERLLVHGPMQVDADTALPAEVVADAWRAVQAAFAQAPVLMEEATVLGDALGVKLTDLPLRQVDLVIDAVVALHGVAPGAAVWASPADAGAARLVLDAHGDDVSCAAALHREVYEIFTERVWELRESRLRAAARPLRFRSHLLLRSQLPRVSRTGSLPGRPRQMADLLLRARAGRRRLATLAPLLERHLGRHHQGPRTNVEVALESLCAVRQLHDALGDRVDVERLRGLLLADAFHTNDLLQPALNLGAALAGWQVKLEALGSADPWALPIELIEPWAQETGNALPAFATALSEVEGRGHPVVPLRQLVDALLLREHAAETESRSEPVATATSGEAGAS